MATQIDLIEFRETGLEKIASSLTNVSKLQGLATASAAKYQKAVDALGRSYRSMETAVKTPQFRERVRETDALVRSQERLTRLYERQAAIARMGTWGGIGSAAAKGASMIGGAAAGGAAAAFGMGVAGLQGTVPMARFQAQFDRLQYELGNLLTPYLNFVTRKTSQAANWLSRRSSGEQDLLGGGVLAGVGLLGANAISRRTLGMGIGSAAMAGGRFAASAGGAAFGAARMAGLSTLASGNMAYGTGGLGGLAGFMAPAAAALGALTLGGAGFYATAQGKLNEQRRKAAFSDPGEHLAAYEAKMQGMTDAQKARFISTERGALLRSDVAVGSGVSKPSMIGALGRILNPYSQNYPGDAAITANEQKRTALAILAGEKKRPDGSHRSNPLVGGDYREIGQGYYAAQAEYMKTAYEKAEGGNQGRTLEENVGIIAAVVEKYTPGGQAPPADPPSFERHAGLYAGGKQ